jgi:hypothetical protein
MRVRIVVLALVMTPFLASYSQGRGKTKESARRETSSKHQQGPEKGQNRDNKNECPADAKSSSSGQHQQQGEHDDANCSTTPATKPPVPVVGAAQIHGMVFNDVTGDGKPDYFEVGLAGWTVTLSGPITATAVTAFDGTYQFLALPTGTYTVCAVKQTSWVATAPTSGPCAGGFGWLLDVPTTMPDLWYGSIDFAVKAL